MCGMGRDRMNYIVYCKPIWRISQDEVGKLRGWIGKINYRRKIGPLGIAGDDWGCCGSPELDRWEIEADGGEQIPASR